MTGDEWYIDLKSLNEEQSAEMHAQYDAWWNIQETVNHLQKEAPRDDALIKSLEQRAERAHTKFREIVGWCVHKMN